MFMLACNSDNNNNKDNANNNNDNNDNNISISGGDAALWLLKYDKQSKKYTKKLHIIDIKIKQ